MEERLTRQIAFLLEIDKLKQIFRQTLLIDGSRHENDAEHSWHLAVMAFILAEHAIEPHVDLTRVLKLVLVHDIVEVDAGDTYAYDEKGYESKAERERQAAERIFGLLPGTQGQEVRQLWDEFEEMATPESRYANALDRLQPFLHNYHTQGLSWRNHGVTADKVRARMAPVKDGSVVLWEYIENLIEDAVRKGWLAP